MANTPSGGNGGGTNIEMLGLGADTSGLVSAGRDVDNFVDKELRAVDAADKLELSARSTSGAIREMGTVVTQTARSAEELVAITQAQARNMVRYDEVMSTANKSAKEQLRLAMEQYEIDKAALQLKADTAKRMREEEAAGAMLLARLNEMVASYGKTREELLRLRAAELGVAEAAEPLINALERQGKSLSQIEYAANRAMEAQEQLYLRGQKATEYSIAKQMEAEESASLKRQARRKQDERDVETNVRQEIEANKRRAQSVEYVANAQMVANDRAAQNRRRHAEEQIRLAEKAALDEIHWNQKSSHSKMDELNKLKAYRQAGISQETIDKTFSKAAQQAAADGRQFSDILRDISFGSSRARAELIVLAHEMATGRFTRIPGSMMVLAEYTNLSALAMSGLGATVLAVTAGVVAYGLAVAGAEAQTKKLNDALNRTNNASGMTKQGLQDVADAAGSLHGNYSDAYEAAAKLAGSGKFTADQLRMIIPAVTEIEHHFDGSLSTSIQEFESLVVRASTKGIQSALGVSRALLDLNDKYHFVNVAQTEELITMERAGKVREASAYAISLYGKEQQRVAAEAKTYMGNMEKAWHAVTGAIGRAKQALLDWGKVQDPKVAREQQLVSVIDNAKNSFNGNLSQEARNRIIANAEKELIKLRNERTEAERKAFEVGEKRRLQDEATGIIRRRQIENDTRLKRTKGEETVALEKFDNENQLLEQASPGYMTRNKKTLDDMREAIKREHAERKGKTDNTGFQLFTIDTKDVDAKFSAIQDAADKHERALEKSLSAQVISEEEAYSAMRNNRADEMRALQAWYAERIALINQNAGKLKPTQIAKQKSEVNNEFNERANGITSAVADFELDRISKEAREYEKLTQSIDRANEREIDRLDKAIAKQRDHNEAIGRTDEQKELALAKRDEALAQLNEREAEAIRLVLQHGEIVTDPKDLAMYQARLAHLDQMIAKQRELSNLHAEGANLEANSPEKLIKDADKLAKSWKQAGESIGESLSKSFGKAGKSAADMFKSYAQGQARQLELNKTLIKEQAAAVGLKDEESKKAEALDKYNSQSARNRMSEYGDMAAGAAGFFDEQSKGYQALMTVSKIFHAAELAMTIAELVPKATAAILNQGSGDPYSAFARMASMAAIVAGLGVAVGAVGGGADSSQSAKARQEAAGKGSVLGDSDAKSASILNALEHMEKDSGLGLIHSAQMVNHLRTIASNITGLTGMVLRTQGITTKPEGIQEGYQGSHLKNALAGGVVGLVAGFIPGLDKLMSKLFGSKTTLMDQGIVGDRTTLGQINQSGLDLDTYNTVNTKKKFLGISYSDKTRETRGELNSEIDQQFTMIIQGMASSIGTAADMLGLGGQEFTDKLNSFVVDIGHVSLKDLDGKEIEEQFQAIFGKIGDDMAKFGLSGLAEFQKAGEGYFETTVRLASDLIQVKDVYKVMGVEFNKTGIDALRMSENLITAAGGIEELTGMAGEFMDAYYSDSERLKLVSESLNQALTEAGVSTGISMSQFNELTRSMLNGTEEGNKMFVTFMKLAPALAEVREAEEERYEEMLSMQLKVAELEKNEIAVKEVTGKIRQKELEKMDESLRPLQQRIWALEDEATATENAKDAADKYKEKMDEVTQTLETNMDNALEGVQRAINASKEVIRTEYDLRVEAYKASVDAQKSALNAQKELAQAARNELKSIFDALSGALKSTKIESVQMDEARRKSAKSYLTSIVGTDLTQAGGLKDALEDVSKVSKSSFTTFLDYARDQARTASLIGILKGQSESKLSDAEKQLKAIDDQSKKLDEISKIELKVMEDKYKADIEAQDKIYENAKTQVELLKGIDTSVKGVTEAVTLLKDAMAGFKAQSGLANGTSSHADAVKSLYQGILGREGEQTGIDFWVDKLKNGSTIADIMPGFTKSEEYKQKQVTDLFQNVLGRTPEKEGLDFWSNALNTISLTQVEKEVKNSPEAKQKQIKDLYKNILGRDGEAEGLKFWTDALNQGVSLAKIEQDFKSSDEYKARQKGAEFQKQYLDDWFNSTKGFAVGTNQVPEDMVAKIHKDERIIPAADNRELMSRLSSPNDASRALVAEVKALRQEVIQLRVSNTAENVAIQKDTATTAVKIKRIESQGLLIKENA